MIAMGNNAPEFEDDYEAIGSAAGFYDDWQARLEPVGISTQDEALAARFHPELGGRQLANRVLTGRARVSDSVLTCPSLPSELNAVQVAKLKVVAAKCPVHRALGDEAMFDERAERPALSA
jgi:hypothetical protein